MLHGFARLKAEIQEVFHQTAVEKEQIITSQQLEL